MPSAAMSWSDERAGAGIRRRHVPLHQMIGEIRQRIAERRELPIEHGGDLRRVGREDDVVEPVVAVHHARRLARRQMRRQPGDQPLHVLDRLRSRRRGIASTSARPGARHNSRRGRNRTSRSRRIERMQPRDGRVHGVVDGRALGRIGRRHLRLPEHAALDIGHDEERRADDALVGAIEHRLGDREVLGGKRADDAVLAVHGMRGGQQLARRLAPQHVAPQRRFHADRSGWTGRP